MPRGRARDQPEIALQVFQWSTRPALRVVTMSMIGINGPPVVERLRASLPTAQPVLTAP
jgi:hypothetical protein